MQHFLRVCLICLSISALSACKTNEEKADAFYQSGLALLDAGDLERAAIQFLNVFQHDGFHEDARRKLAEIRLEQGDIGAAYSQYLRLIEQYPDTPDVRILLARIAIDASNWDEARRHGQAAVALAPEDPQAQAIAVALAYRDASQINDTAALAGAHADSDGKTLQHFVDHRPNHSTQHANDHRWFVDWTFDQQTIPCRGGPRTVAGYRVDERFLPDFGATRAPQATPRYDH